MASLLLFFTSIYPLGLDLDLISLGMPYQDTSFFPFYTVHGVLKARIPKWLAIPFSSGPPFVRTLHHDPSVMGGLTQQGL